MFAFFYYYLCCRLCAVPDGRQFQNSSAGALGTGVPSLQSVPGWHPGNSQPALAPCKHSLPIPCPIGAFFAYLAGLLAFGAGLVALRAGLLALRAGLLAFLADLLAFRASRFAFHVVRPTIQAGPPLVCSTRKKNQHIELRCSVLSSVV